MSVGSVVPLSVVTLQDKLQLEWQKTAARLRRRVNLAWWYQEVTIPLVLVALVGGSFALLARWYEWSLNAWFWTVIGVLALGACGFAFWRARRKWLTMEQAYVRLDADLGLCNALSTALAGRGSWPKLLEGQSVVRWRAGQVALPVVGAFLFLLFGFALPVAPAKQGSPELQPYTWSRLASEVEELVEEGLIDEDYADEVKERLEELREQKAEEWFSAASLEATDSLQQAHSREMNRLKRDLMEIQKTLKKAGNPDATKAQRQKLQQQFEEAMEGMRNGQMKPNEELMKQLSEAAKQGMEQMSEEERQRMQEKLKELADQLGENPGEGEGEGEGEGPDGEAGPGNGEGEPRRGPGAASDLFGADSPKLDAGKFEHLDGEDDKEPEPGDLLNLEEIEHDLDKSKQGPTTSGAAKSEGTGGDRVWKDALDPDEQKSLKSFFE